VPAAQREILGRQQLQSTLAVPGQSLTAEEHQQHQQHHQHQQQPAPQQQQSCQEHTWQEQLCRQADSYDHSAQCMSRPAGTTPQPLTDVGNKQQQSRGLGPWQQLSPPEPLPLGQGGAPTTRHQQFQAVPGPAAPSKTTGALAAAAGYGPAAMAQLHDAPGTTREKSWTQVQPSKHKTTPALQAQAAAHCKIVQPSGSSALPPKHPKLQPTSQQCCNQRQPQQCQDQGSRRDQAGRTRSALLLQRLSAGPASEQQPDTLSCEGGRPSSSSSSSSHRWSWLSHDRRDAEGRLPGGGPVAGQTEVRWNRGHAIT
jgi:hypothetical protein